MQRFRDPVEMMQFLDRQAQTGVFRGAAKGPLRGFVPTMGALHQGHLSLVAESARRCRQTVVSIFVNPTQFDRAEDLERYPRREEDDCRLLEHGGCDAVWMPGVADLYPQGAEVRERWDLAGLDEGMEGAHRPGHFAGVAQVVMLLLRAVRPDILFLGRKDYQQFRILQHVVALEGLPVEVVACPIVREADGLAMSSRNLRLDAEARGHAAGISAALFAARDRARSEDPGSVVAFARDALASAPGLEPEYAELVDAHSLRPLDRWPEGDAVLCAAAWAGGVRLIDNVRIGPEHRR